MIVWWIGLKIFGINLLLDETNEGIRTLLKDRLVAFNMRIEQLNQMRSTGNIVSTPIPFGVKPGEKYKPPPLAKKNSGKKTWH